MQSVLEKLNQMDNLEKLTYQDILELEFFSSYENPEVRSRVAEILVGAESSKLAERVLLKLCEDSDELVRANACDSLSCFHSKIVVTTLQCIFINKNESDLVRWYALMSILDIVQMMPDFTCQARVLFEKAIHDSSIPIRGTGYMGLYRLGDNKQLTPLITLLTSPKYQDRCAIIYMLESIVDEKNRNIVIDALKRQRSIEKARAVTLRLDDLIAKLQ